MTKKIPEYPEDIDRLDYAAAHLQGVAGTLPIVGSYVSPFVALAIGSPLQKRQDEWHKKLADTVEELGKKIIDMTPEKLSGNQAFVNTVIAASNAAIATSDEEKRNLLANAVYNVGAGLSLGDFIEAHFLDILRRYTVSHIQILNALNENSNIPAAMDRAEAVNSPRLSFPRTVDRESDLEAKKGRHIKVEFLIPFLMTELDEIVGVEGYRDLLRDDLVTDKLGKGHVYENQDMVPADVVTDRGKAFLEFLADPDKK